MQEVKKKNVTLLPGLFKERSEVNRKYLHGLSKQGLLQSYYLEAGIVMPGLQVMHDPDAAELHWGWEAPTCQLRGHFLGHFLSAAASLAVTEQDGELKAKIEAIVAELKKCQELNGGEWVGPIPEKYFKKLENNQYVWSPQYVMHKLLMGLCDVYRDLQNEEALSIINRLSDWYMRWTKDMETKNPHAVYSGEEAGMLEVWATLFELTGEEKYRVLAERYSHSYLFENLFLGKDALTNCHENASIPWSHGAAKMYEITGDEKWRTVVELFWKNAVTDRGCYCTGAQGAGEYWTPPQKMGQFLGDRNQEFCTVYNMVRTASYLYKWTGDIKYADYIEKNLYNGFLAQQNAETGMPTYFLPLKTGSRKKWGSLTRDFWCCHGTMVQAQTLYPSLVYYLKPETVVVSQYIPSKMQCVQKESLVSIEQCVNMKYYNEQAFFDEKDESQMSRWFFKFRVSAEKEAEFTMSFRIPGWVKKQPVVTVNGEEVSAAEIKDGYLNLTRAWQTDEVLIYFPCGLTAEKLPDRPDLMAFLEGPVVLAGLCGTNRGIIGNAANAESIFTWQTEHTYEVFPWKQSTYKTIGQKQETEFIPLYEVKDEVYTVYFTEKA
ncbi:MAG: glycoside hydrolase family 127 protein [Lachnospiraceae bacterium]|nr:glycoside hydrolase family 127 protein [Lachnospiraceae bacterium]